MNWFKTGDLLDRAFGVGIILKGLDGVLEVVGGVLLLIVSPTTIDQLSRALTQHELSEDPHDFLATHLLHAAGSLTGSSLQFGAAYLLLHGVVKIVLVSALLRDKIWAYPWMRFSDRVHRLPDLQDDFRFFHWATGAHGLRCRGRLAHVSGIWQTAANRRTGGCPLTDKWAFPPRGTPRPHPSAGSWDRTLSRSP